MKGLKLYALIGTFAVATASALPYAFAGEIPGAAKGAANKLNYNELNNNSERGVRLDELFECFKKEPTKEITTAKTTAVARLTPDNPLAHTTLKSNNNKKISKSMTAHVPAKAKTATAAKTHKTPASTKVEPVELDSDSPVVTAKYSGGSGSHIVPVSSVSHDETPVISAKLDKSGHLPKYKAGEQMVVKVKANQDCNIIVFDYDAHGTLTQLFPNAFEKSGTLHAGESVEIGGPQSQYTLDVSGKGTERIFVYAYPVAEGSITVAMNPVVNTPFRSVELSADQYHRMVNQSRSYFEQPSTERTVSIKAKAGMVAEVSNPQQANKIELSFQVDK